LGLALVEVKAALDDPAFDPAAVLDDQIAVVEQRLADERDLLHRLRSLRGTAEAGWGAIVDAIALTARLAHRDPIVRLRAVLEAPSTPLSMLVEQLAAEPDQGVRDIIAWAIAQQGGAGPAVAARLHDPAPAVRESMARVLAKVPAPGFERSLASLLDDPDDGVRRAAVSALGRAGGPVAVTALVARLGDPDERFAEVIAHALAGCGDEAVAPLTEVLRAAAGQVRLRAIDVLGRLDAEAATDVLAEFVSDAAPDAAPDAVVAALAGLAGEDGAAVRAAVAAALGSPHPRVRTLAARITTDRATPPPLRGRTP